MFTIKFITYFSGETSEEVVISTPRYEIYSHPQGLKTVTMYKDLTEDTGVSYLVASNEIAERIELTREYHHVCYIENIQGKTINKL